MATQKTASDVLRDFIRADGRTSYQLWKASGVSQAALSRFMRGERDLNLRTASALMKALGVKLVRVRKDR